MQINAPQSTINTTPQGQLPTGAVPLKGLTPNGLVAGSLLNGFVLDTDQTRTVITLAGGQDVELPPQPDLNKRDQVALTVLTVRPQVTVRVDKAEITDARSSQDVGLRDGQTTAARVLAQNSDGTVQIDLNGHIVTADTPADVEVGSLLPVRVRDVGGQLMLSILRGEKGIEALAQQFLKEQVRSRDSLGRMLGGLLDRLRSLVELSDSAETTEHAANSKTPANQPAQQQSLAGLKQLLEFFQLQDEPGHAAIERSVQDGGLFLEAKLSDAVTGQANDAALASDLKAALLKAADAPPTPDAQLNALLQDAKSELERLQLSNVLSQLHDGALLWQLPGWPNSSPISLRVERDDDTVGSQDAPDAWQFLVSVDLDRLGPVRVDSRLQGGTFRAIFYVDAAHVAEFKAGLSALQQELTGDEFSKVMLAVRDVDDLPSSLARKFQDATDGSPSSVNVVDVEG